MDLFFPKTKAGEGKEKTAFPHMKKGIIH